MTRSFFLRVLLALGCLMAACDDGEAPATTFAFGDPIGAAVEATIGPEGGTLALADGSLALTFPAGAVSAQVDVRVQEVTRTAPHGDGRAFRLEPHDVEFAVPVTIAFAIPEADLARPSAGALRPAFQDDRGVWNAVLDAELDRDARTLRVSTTHFSDWTYLEAFTLAPSEASVRTGASVELVVSSCTRADGAALSRISEVEPTCTPFTLHPLLREPSVNGVVGGSAAAGSVARNAATLTYTAPSTVPSPNPVAVSVAIDLLDGARLLLVSEITVLGADALHGTARLVSDDGFSAVAEVTWTAVGTTIDGVVQYRPSGVLTVTWPNGCTVSPASGPISANDGYLEIDSTTDPPRYYGNAATSFPATVTCPDVEPLETQAAAVWFLVTEPTAAKDGAPTLEGTTATHTWSFTR